MKFFSVLVALVAAIPAVLGLTINSPASVVACQPTQLQWSGGQAPYFLSLVPAGQPSAPALETFPTQNGNSFTWNVDRAAGTSFTIVLKDSTGSVAYSSIITVQSGGSATCSTSSASGGSTASGTSASGSTSTPGSSASPSASPGSVGVPTSASTPASGSATSSAANGSATTKTGAASRLSTSSAFGVAGVMGLVGAVLF